MSRDLQFEKAETKVKIRMTKTAWYISRIDSWRADESDWALERGRHGSLSVKKA